MPSSELEGLIATAEQCSPEHIPAQAVALNQQILPAPPFPPASPYPFYPVPTAHLGYRALKHLVKHLPPPQNYAEWVYQQALRKEVRSRRWQLFFALIPRP